MVEVRSGVGQDWRGITICHVPGVQGSKYGAKRLKVVRCSPGKERCTVASCCLVDLICC